MASELDYITGTVQVWLYIDHVMAAQWSAHRNYVD
jgi:hypothetical protein